MIAGDGDVMADVPSSEMTFEALGSPDKALLRVRQVGRPCRRLRPLRPRLEPQRAPEVFPAIIDWLDCASIGPAVAAVAAFNGRASNASMQICDQVSNRSRPAKTSSSETNPASARPSSRGDDFGPFQIDRRGRRPDGPRRRGSSRR